MKSFSHKRPIRDDAGMKIGERPGPAFRVTDKELGGSFGCHRECRLVVGLEAGDILSFRPAGTRQRVTAAAVDLYRSVLQWNVDRRHLEKARKKKESKQRLREQRRLKYAESKLTRPIE